MKMAVSREEALQTDREDDYVVIDFPIRMTSGELERLTSTARRIRASESAAQSPFAPINLRYAAARDRAMSHLDFRGRRDAVFQGGLFADPAWDILLDLFVRQIDGLKTSTTSAARAAQVPLSTALRHVNKLVQNGLVVRSASPVDLRLNQVRLSDAGFTTMLNLLLAD